jgi:hypothetical protein
MPDGNLYGVPKQEGISFYRPKMNAVWNVSANRRRAKRRGNFNRMDREGLFQPYTAWDPQKPRAGKRHLRSQTANPRISLGLGIAKRDDNAIIHVFP